MGERKEEVEGGIQMKSRKNTLRGEEKAGGKADCRVERMNLNKGRIKELRPR